MNEGIVLGHHVSSQRIKDDQAKIVVIKNVPPPLNQRDVRSFLGKAGSYRRLIEGFNKITTPMFALLTKDTDFVWIENCVAAFEHLKENTITTPVLQGPKWFLPFHINSDAFDKAIGAVLGQQEDKKSFAIHYINKNLPGVELNYKITKKELLVFICSINKFRHYIIGYQIVVHIDHSTIRFLMNKLNTGGRIIRWLLLL